MKKRSYNPLTVILLVLYALGGFSILSESSRGRGLYEFFMSMFGPAYQEKQAVPPLEEMTEQERLLMQGDLSQEDPALQWKALYLSKPDEPAYYADYLKHVKKLPKDFDKTVQNIALQNGWFLFQKAAHSSLDAVKKITVSRQDKDETSDPAQWEILDAELLKSSVQLIDNSFQKEQFDHYSDFMNEQRAPLRTVSVDFLSNIMHISQMSASFSPNFEWKKVADLILAALQEAKNETEYRRLEAISLKMESRCFELSRTLIDSLICEAVMKVLSQQLSHQAKRLGLNKEVELYGKKYQDLESRREQLTKNHSSETYELLAHRASILTTLSAPAMNRVTKNSPQLTAELLRPGLRTERAMATRVWIVPAFILFTLLTIFVWLRNRNRNCPAEFKPVPRILFLGIIFPFLLCIIFRYFLSFGMLDFGGRLFLYSNYLLPDVVIFMILLAAPISVVRAKQEISGGFLKRWGLLGFCVLNLILGAVLPHAPNILPAFWILVILNLIWFISLIFRKETDQHHEARALIAPAYLLAAALLGLSFQGLLFEERYHFKNAAIEKPTVYNMTLLEEQTVEAHKAEIAGFLE